MADSLNLKSQVNLFHVERERKDEKIVSGTGYIDAISPEAEETKNGDGGLVIFRQVQVKRASCGIAYSYSDVQKHGNQFAKTTLRCVEAFCAESTGNKWLRQL